MPQTAAVPIEVTQKRLHQQLNGRIPAGATQMEPLLFVNTEGRITGHPNPHDDVLIICGLILVKSYSDP